MQPIFAHELLAGSKLPEFLSLHNLVQLQVTSRGARSEQGLHRACARENPHLEASAEMFRHDWQTMLLCCSLLEKVTVADGVSIPLHTAAQAANLSKALQSAWMSCQGHRKGGGSAEVLVGSYRFRDSGNNSPPALDAQPTSSLSKPRITRVDDNMFTFYNTSKVFRGALRLRLGLFRQRLLLSGRFVDDARDEIPGDDGRGTPNFSNGFILELRSVNSPLTLVYKGAAFQADGEFNLVDCGAWSTAGPSSKFMNVLCVMCVRTALPSQSACPWSELHLDCKHRARRCAQEGV
mmetsp:Transcript_29922/g.79704  ORF Transcript_29922/g.79704 Transcript_29922/m.79704 type:complete len:293 (-) Transcript_29922:52-930(-)